MAKTPPEVSEYELIKDIENPLDKCLEKQGITAEYLAEKLKEELEAKEKGKGIAWKIRQEARKDAHKLRGDYPVERTDLSGEITLKVVYDDQLQGKEENAKTGS
ncbi:MAG: hypothetical protein ACTSPI_16875 [Candidatus Heimdallarchaeaceae archaeon]